MIDAGFVEKALLGALLHQPEGRQSIPWLRFEDLNDPLCRALLTHLDRALAQGQGHIDYLDISEALRRDTQLHPRHTAPSRIAELHVNAPIHPNVGAYARILLEVAIRNQVAHLGIRLTQLSANGAPTPDPSHRHAVEELLNRWDQAQPNTKHAKQPVTERHPQPMPIEPPQPTTAADLHEAQYATIAALVHDRPHGIRASILHTLQPDDFPQPEAAATFRAVERLAHRGEHIDEITITWDTLRHRDVHGSGIDLAHLTHQATVGVSPPQAIQLMQHTANTRRARQAGTRLTAEANNLRTRPDATARHALSTLKATISTQTHSDRL